jgi:Ca2+-binding RTX toxin-like protein
LKYKGATEMATINGTQFNDNNTNNNGQFRPSLVGTAQADTINGLAGNDRLFGLAGNDVLNGGVGNDTLNGGAGRDTLNGGAGNDNIRSDGDGGIYRGQAGNDVMFSASGPETLDGGIGVDLINHTAFTGDYVFNMETGLTNFANERFTNFENATMGSGNDRVTGNVSNNVINGGAGNDSLNGGAGNDLLNGGAGNDLLNGGAGNDQLYGESGNDFLSGGNGNDVIRGGEGKDTINGGIGNDNLGGGKGNDSVNGGSGDDLIIGVAGTPLIGGNSGSGELDILTGGIGSDKFYLGDNFEAYYDDQGTVDFAVITDFTQLDKIVLNGKANDYVVQNQAAFLPELGGLVQGTGILKKGANGTNDLIGIVQNIVGLNLNSSVFQFVNNDITLSL